MIPSRGMEPGGVNIRRERTLPSLCTDMELPTIVAAREVWYAWQN